MLPNEAPMALHTRLNSRTEHEHSHRVDEFDGGYQQRSDAVRIESPRTSLINCENNENTLDKLDLLSEKWLSSSQLARLAREQGLVYKKGKFSTLERERVKAAIRSYRITHGLDSQQLEEVIYQNHGRADGFWTDIASVVPNRPLVAVYQYVRRAYQPLGKQGAWTASEDNDLVEAFVTHGPRWKIISTIVGRSDTDCRDRYRDFLNHRNVRVKGRWSDAEEAELSRVMSDIFAEQGCSHGLQICWMEVSRRMNHTRSQRQCNVKWTELQNRKLTAEMDSSASND